MPLARRAPPPRSRRTRAAALAAAALVAAVVAGATVAGGCGEGRPGRAPPPSTLRFEERAAAAGLDFATTFLATEQGAHFKVNLYDHGSGVAIADVDGDGDDDVYLCNQLGSNALFENDGHGRFTDVTARAGVALADRISVAATFADVDADGDQDLYVTTTRGGNAYFRNRGDGTFEDATAAAGLTLVAHAEQGFFFDADRDGDLDLLVTNTARWTTETKEPQGRWWLGAEDLFALVDSEPEHNRFFRNRGDATFDDATEASGLAGTGWGGDAAVFDADDDGDLDVFVCNMFGRSALYVNDGAGRFTDEAGARLRRTSWGAVGARAFDHDGDGRLDLFVVDMHSDMWMEPSYDPTSRPESAKYDGVYGPTGRPDAATMIARLRYRVDEVVFGSTLYRRLPGGGFEERSAAARVETLWPWGLAVADFDADGFEDVFVPTGMGYPYAYWRSPLLHNRGDGSFDDVASTAGLDPPPGGIWQRDPIGGAKAARSARAAATADFDGDGRVDLVVSTFNDRALLYRNTSPPGNWLGLRLVGAGKNRDAIGALVRLSAGGRTFVRLVQAAGGYLAQSSATLHVGLGHATAIEGGEIRWPDGRVQPIGGLVAGRVHTIVEAGAASPR